MKLYRTNDDRQLAGVCGGLAKYLGWSSTRLRIAWVLGAIFTAFAGVVVYLVLWFLMPAEPPPAPAFDPPPVQPWKRSV